MRVTDGGLRRLAAQLHAAPGVTAPQARQVVKKGAVNIKGDARRRIGRPRHAPHYPGAITFDVGSTPAGPHADIGPDKQRRQGPLGNVLEFGSPTSAPHPHMRPAAEAELPRFAKAMQDLAVQALGP